MMLKKCVLLAFVVTSVVLRSQPLPAFVTSEISDGKNEFILRVAIDSMSETCVLDSILVSPVDHPEKKQSLKNAGSFFSDDRASMMEDSDYLRWGNKYFLQDINMDGHADVCAVHYSYDEEEHLNTFRYYWVYDPRTGIFLPDTRFSSLVNPLIDAGNKTILDPVFYDDSCSIDKYLLADDVLTLKATRCIGHTDYSTFDSLLFIVPHNDGGCNDDHQFTTTDHINYFLPYDDADLLDGGFTIIPQFPFEKIVITENFTLAYGAKVSETEGWLFYDTAFSDSVNKHTCFSYSPTKTLKNDGWFTYETGPTPTSEIATHCPKPKVNYKTADYALRKAAPDFYAFVYQPDNYSDDDPKRKKQEELDHSTQLYYYMENITITIYSNGQVTRKVLHLYVRHGEC
ncbi:MAG TPA: hypothetical protein VL651_01675 [Bacteroidia bacterium]|jgi:hypothetical protein|nr:hypothetical protein [Bacteroidia bacterium]